MTEPKRKDANDPAPINPTAWSRFESGHPTLWAILMGLGFLFALAFGLFRGLVELGGMPRTPEGQGYLIGAMLGSFTLTLVGVAIYYWIRKARRSKRRFLSAWVAWALLLSIISGLGALTDRHRPPHFPGNEKEFGRVVVQAYKEASGVVPASQFSTDDFAVTMRDMFRDVIQFRQQYQDVAAQFDTREMKELYAPSSFRDRKRIEETVRQLRKMESEEQRFSSLDPIFVKFDANIQQKAWPDYYKREFLKGMHQSMAQVDQSRKAVFQIEQKWLDASVDLYVFAENNLSAISVRRNQVIIPASATRETFNQKLHSAVEFQQQALAAEARFDQKQATNSQKYGISPSDLGLK